MSNRVLLYIGLAVVLLLITLQNAGVVRLRLLFWSFDISTIVLVPVLIVIGLIAGFIWGRSKWN